MVEREAPSENEKMNSWNIMEQFQLAGPACLSFIMRKITNVLSVIAVGHIGPHYLAAAGVASVTSNVTGNALIYGLTGALSTLCSQAYGAKDFQTMGLSLQRALIIVNLFISLPISILWWFSQPIIVSLGQDRMIAKDAEAYLRVLIPTLWSLACASCIQNWLYAQRKTNVVAGIITCLAIIHPIWLYFYIFYLDLGYIGAALAVSTTKISETTLLILYVCCFSTVLKDTEFAWSREAFRNWLPYLKLGLPNILMLMEWSASEIIIFLSGTLPNPQLQVSTMSIYQNLLGICFMIPQGFHVAANTIVGNALGAGDPGSAHKAAIVSPSLAFCLSSGIASIILAFDDKIGLIYTTDADVVAAVATVAPLTAVYVVCDGVQTSLTGVLKGLGKQAIAGPIVIFAYYVVGIPLSVYLAFSWGKGWGVFGLCVGTTVGTAVHMLCYIVVVYFMTNWEKEALQVQERMSSKSKGEKIQFKALSRVDDDDDGWWEDLSFQAFGEGFSSSAGKSRNSWGSVMKRWLGLKPPPSDYEMVRTSLSAFNIDEASDVEEIDFDVL